MKIKHLAILLLAALTTASCLDEDPKSQLTEEQAFENATALYKNTVATLYNYIGGSSDSQGLQGTYRGVYDFNTFTTDEAIIPTRGGDWFDGGFWQDLYLHKWRTYDEALYATWLYLYKAVGQCNFSLEKLDAYGPSLLSDHELQASKAEVRALRAMFYYYLMDMFGRVPLSLSSDLKALTQPERSVTYRFIVGELQACAPLLTARMSQHEGYYYGKFNQGAAYFLLAKLALNAEVYADDDWTDGRRPDGKDIFFEVDGQRLNAWQTALAYCRKVEALGYRLEPDYTANFSITNEVSAENIFTIPMDKTLYTNVFKNLFRSRHYSHGSAVGTLSENGSCATVSTVQTYGYGTPDEDARFRLNCFADEVYVDGAPVALQSGEPLVYQPLEVRLDLTGSPYEKTAGARMNKYEIDRTAYSDGQLQSNDIVLFRYADVVLMAAEAKVRNGEDGAAELHQIRSRVGMPDRPATLANLLDERLMELMWEGWRRQDLVRFGRFHQAYDLRPQLDDEASAYTTVFPIPARVLSLNKQLRQNPGYEKK